MRLELESKFHTSENVSPSSQMIEKNLNQILLESGKKPALDFNRTRQKPHRAVSDASEGGGLKQKCINVFLKPCHKTWDWLASPHGTKEIGNMLCAFIAPFSGTSINSGSQNPSAAGGGTHHSTGKDARAWELGVNCSHCRSVAGLGLGLSSPDSWFYILTNLLYPPFVLPENTGTESRLITLVLSYGQPLDTLPKYPL